MSHDDVFDLPEDRRFDGTRESEFPPENRESWLEPEFAEGQSITRHWGWLLVLGIAWMLFELSADPAISVMVASLGLGGNHFLSALWLWRCHCASEGFEEGQKALVGCEEASMHALEFTWQLIPLAPEHTARAG